MSWIARQILRKAKIDDNLIMEMFGGQIDQLVREEKSWVADDVALLTYWFCCVFSLSCLSASAFVRGYRK